MPIKAKKSNDLDKLFEDLGVLDFGEGIDVPKTPEEIARAEKEAKDKNEDPYARFLEPQNSDAS
ncbi:MAG: hypothetical protein LBI43_01610 [Streptococcaceae bacterium]|jgi:hypothetical protein|nr:hypothetical protein [Streptococcaceae bacterium]